MQTHVARTRQRRWRRRGRVLLLGVVLGLIQGLLALGWGWLPHWPFAWMLFVALSLFFYLFLPAVEGFLAARQSGAASSASSPGCLVGGIGFLVIALAAAVTLLVMPPMVRTSCPPGETCNDKAGAGFVVGFATFLIQVIIIIFFLLEGMAGAIGGLLGGWIGGVLGQKRAAMSRQRGETAAGDAPSSGDSNHGAM